MLLPDRVPVIKNMQAALAAGNQNAKVELGDPELNSKESLQLVNDYVAGKSSVWFRCKSWFANGLFNIASRCLNRRTEIIGLEKLGDFSGGALVTCNHFNPVDSTVVRLLALTLKKPYMGVVSQDTNLKMPGLFGFFMTNLNIIPLNKDRHYLTESFPKQLKQEFERDNLVLIYPEQEMWFNYRRPRTPKRGAYLYAAQLGMPIISCFTEIIDCPEEESQEFVKQRYRLHVLGVISPDSSLSVLENSKVLCQKDFELKKTAYETIYGKKWEAPFSLSDIAGWKGR